MIIEVLDDLRVNYCLPFLKSNSLFLFQCLGGHIVQNFYSSALTDLMWAFGLQETSKLLFRNFSFSHFLDFLDI